VHLTVNQIIGIAIVILSVLSGASSQLTELFGTKIATDIVISCNLLTAIVSGVLVMLTSQSSQIKNVLAMPGVEKIDVNEKANAALAAIAIDPEVNKIGPTPAAASRVEATAAANS
jgi:hypothetical protein